MRKLDIVRKLLGHRWPAAPITHQGVGFAPANMALIKYWGKRDQTLHLPHTSSLSVSLRDHGNHVTIQHADAACDTLTINDQAIPSDHPMRTRLSAFLDLFRIPGTLPCAVRCHSRIPIAAGLASSAAACASWVQALDHWMGWSLAREDLSILARLGSGSACRSLWDGFVLWEAGTRADGMDSHGIPLQVQWPDLRIGLVLCGTGPKALSSRQAMHITCNTSPFYTAWTQQVVADLDAMQAAIHQRDFTRMGATAERNACTMHALLLSSTPTLCYWNTRTLDAIHTVWALRKAHVPVYFTQDAGPHLAVLFEQTHTQQVTQSFPDLVMIPPFAR